MIRKRFNKKAQVLKTIQIVLSTLFIIMLFGVVMTIGVVKLRDSADTIDRQTVSFTNITTNTVVNGTPGANVTGTTNLRKCSLSGLTVSYNATNSTCSAGIESGNYTVVNCEIRFKGNGSNGQDSSCYNNTIWNVTGSYTFSNEVINDVTKNLSSGLSEYGENTTTYFSILAIILIIAILGILISYALGLLGGTGNIGSTSVNIRGSGGSGGLITGKSAFTRSSDRTVMGI